MDALIDGTSRSWNLQVIRTLVDPQDVKIIESIPISRFHLEDRNGWHFTNNGKYTVKSGYEASISGHRKYATPVWSFDNTVEGVLLESTLPTQDEKFFVANFNWVYSG